LSVGKTILEYRAKNTPARLIAQDFVLQLNPLNKAVGIQGVFQYPRSTQQPLLRGAPRQQEHAFIVDDLDVVALDLRGKAALSPGIDFPKACELPGSARRPASGLRGASTG